MMIIAIFFLFSSLSLNIITIRYYSLLFVTIDYYYNYYYCYHYHYHGCDEDDVVTATCSPRVWHWVIHWVISPCPWVERWQTSGPIHQKNWSPKPTFFVYLVSKVPISGRISAIQLFSAW